MLGRLFAQVRARRDAGARPAAASEAPASAATPASAQPDLVLRDWLARDTFPTYTREQLGAHPQRLRAARILAQEGDMSAAEQALRQALQDDPASPIDHMLLAEVLYRRGDYAQARHSFDAAMTDTGRIGARAAAMLAEQTYLRGEYALAGQLIERAAAVAPEAMSCQIVLGCLQDAQGSHSADGYARALAHFRLAQAARPESPLARVHVATALIRLGALQEGLSEWVTAECLGGTYVNRHLCPVWDGRPLGTDRLLILTHSGYGDVIQFMRFAQHLRARAPRARLGVLIRQPLARLAENMGLFEHVYGGDMGAADFDWQVSQTHLPLLLGLSLADLQADQPYLRVPPPQVEAAARWLPPRAPGKLRVGLRWAGHPGYTDATRSVALEALRPLFEVAGVEWISLAEGDSQGGVPVRDFGLVDVSAHLIDFQATAALMCNLDLVIAVDTSAAHLAGALNLPTWLLARPNPDWRWGGAGTATPWYGSVRVFRHPEGPGLNWDAVAGAMALALRERVAARAIGRA